MRASILQVKWEKRYADRSSRYVTELSCKNRIRLLNTTLAFEYSTVDAEIHGKIDSVMNPASGIIRADEIGELIMDQIKVDPAQTKIICSSVKSEKSWALRWQVFLLEPISGGEH